jgi:anthranilate phosphoribosyltransferase
MEEERTAEVTPRAQEASRPIDFVKKVGRGRTLSQDLSRAEADRAFRLLLAGGFSPVQLGAFLQALRIKELTQEELDALAGAFRDGMPRLPSLPGRHALVLNIASDTSRKGGLASLPAAALLRRMGVAVGVVRSEPVLSGNRASFEASLELARRIDPGIDGAVVRCADLVPGLAALDALRGQLGFRSCLHTAEKLVNPWPDAPALLGISHRHYALRMAGALTSLGLRGRILLGNHGTVDLVLHKETAMVVAGPDGIREESVSPASLGLSLSSDVYSLARFGEWKEWLRDPAALFAPGAPGSGAAGGAGALRDVILYHAAVFLWCAGAAPDPAAGLAMALDSWRA